ncbi:aldose 1-epimerase family protein [Algoriphagus sediminis]|uniref:Aldose 1-epimerase family protein n=1 Tax=Algoriphagus sediminis TaxID=3057113 RepID=A0ABT7Y8Y8_9BACT|nr:aldose 1-epimerase family protein [Algoriphagus sediminis]MDN3202974.1 aldose 1-epimerase family protein [Algoriphagus sediminis]
MNIEDQKSWKGKLSNHQQMGGIETSILDNGAGKGVRIAWINTGTGLRYKVVLDRGMDILDAFFGEKSLAYISHLGITRPQPFSNQGINWLRTFGGGLLTTCGLSSMGGPNEVDGVSHGLHGRYSNIPVELLCIKQPDIHSGDLSFEMVGVVKETSIFGPNLELKRTISGVLGSAEIRISDSVRNCGNTSTPLMLLYHINCGWPIIDEGTRVIWKGERIPRESDDQLSDFNKEHNFKVIPAPLQEHSGFGEDVSFIQPEKRQVICGFANDEENLALKIEFSREQLPWLIHWQHLGKNDYVTALEPATNPPIGQKQAKEEGTLIELKPGEVRDFDLKLSVLTGQSVTDFT